MSQFFIHEQPIVVLPSLVGVVGFARAVILQQIHYTTNQPRSGVTLDDGYKWVWNSYKQWREDYLPFLSERQIQRHVVELEEKGFLLSCQAEKSNWDRTKYYRINYDLFVVNSKYLALKNESADDDKNVLIDDDTLGSIEDVENEMFFLTNYSSKDISEQNGNRSIEPMTETLKNPSSPEKEKSSAPPAVLAVREVCKRFPPKPIWHVIQDAIGDTPDIDRLQKTYEGWVLNGFKPTNYAWATDWYPKGITSKQEAYQTEIKKTEPSYNYVRNQPTQREAIAAEQEMLAKIYESTTRS